MRSYSQTVAVPAAAQSAVTYPFHFGARLNFFEQLFPGEMRLLEHLGIHPLASTPLTDPFSKSGAKTDFRNIGEHSIAVASAARVLSKLLVEAGTLPMREHRRVVQRALLHDAFKPYEIMYRRAHGDQVDTSACRAAALAPLAKERLPSYLLQQLLTAGAEVGHENIRVHLRWEGGQPRLKSNLLSEKIVFFADAITASSVPSGSARAETFFTTSEERMNRCSGRYLFLWNDGFALNDRGVIEAVTGVDNLPSSWKSLGSHAELQMFAAREIAKELSGYLLPGGVEDPHEAEEFLLRLISQEIDTAGLSARAFKNAGLDSFDS